MNRIPRRSSKIKPPLRGRLAASLSPERQKCFSTPVTRPRPTIAKNIISQPASQLISEKVRENVESFAQPQAEITPTSKIDSVTPPILDDEIRQEPKRQQTKYVGWLIGLAIAMLLLFLWFEGTGRF